MKPKFVAGNWKMNKDLAEGLSLVNALNAAYTAHPLPAVELAIFAPFIHLGLIGPVKGNFKLGAQNCSQFGSGAYTGEVSAKMLKSVGVDYCLDGHSERRVIFGETNAITALKVDQLLENDIRPVLCIGESLEERKAENQNKVVSEQLEQGLFHLDETRFNKCIIAYEPVWAIGTGLTASPAQAQEMHAHIRSLVGNKYGQKVAAEVPILYGGSCNSSNAIELFQSKDINGGLIGGASLDATHFYQICSSFTN